MFFEFRNLIRHFIVLIISFMILFPCMWVLNKSYYTSISKVNYWEEKEIVGLLTYILSHTDNTEIENSLGENLDNIEFFDIKILKNGKSVVHKKMKHGIDLSSTNRYSVNKYEMYVTKRTYPTYIDDYKRYLSALFKDQSKLSLHRNLVLVVAHFNILLLLEICLICISVKYKLQTISIRIPSDQLREV